MTKRLISLCLIALLLIASSLTVLPTPSQAADFNFDGSIIKINQKFEGSGERDYRDYNNNDDADILITILAGATIVVLGSAYLVWYSVSQIPEIIKRELPVKNSEFDNTISSPAIVKNHS